MVNSNFSELVELADKALPVLDKVIQLLVGIGAFIGAWYAKRSADRNNKSLKSTQALIQDNTNITVGSQEELKKLQAYVTKVQTKHAKELSEANRKIQSLSDELHILRRQLEDESELPTKLDI